MSDEKKLVVFYSRTGVTKKVAEEIAKNISCDLEQIYDEKDRSGILGYIKSGKDAISKNNTVIKEMKFKPEEYDVVIIGSPVWGSHVTPAVRTYINNFKEKFSKVAFFSTQGGSDKNPKVFKDMKELTLKKPLACLNVTGKSMKNEDYVEKVKIFSAEILK